MSQNIEGRPSAPAGTEKKAGANKRGSADDNPFQPAVNKGSGAAKDKSDNSPSEKTLIEESDGEEQSRPSLISPLGPPASNMKNTQYANITHVMPKK